jgi:hypothetical protein
VVPAALAWDDLLQSIHVAPSPTARVYTMGTAFAEGLAAPVSLRHLLVMGAGGDYSILFLVLHPGREARHEVRQLPLL